MPALTCTINHSVKVAHVGAYQSIVEIIDDATGEQIICIEREHTKRRRPGVAKSSLKEAREIADEMGYMVSKVNSSEYGEVIAEDGTEEEETAY